MVIGGGGYGMAAGHEVARRGGEVEEDDVINDAYVYFLVFVYVLRE